MVNLGQYFTTNKDLKEKIYKFILNKPLTILEPCIGQGDLVSFIKNKLDNVKFDMYEIDSGIDLLEGVSKNKVIYGDFLKQNIDKQYKTIIGNPPYIRTTKGNLYIDFTEKCFNLLEEKGELIFIVPSDFFKLTSACNLLNKMMEEGTFTHVFHPHNEKLFDNATIDIIIFRYCKNKSLEKNVLYNDTSLYITNTNGLITFSKEKINDMILFKDYFDIYVGLVSGKESVYKNQEIGNISLLYGPNKLHKYIYIEEFPCENEKINKHLLKYKTKLIERQIRKFDELNWFEWGAPRNIKAIQSNIGKECIYIYNLTRKAVVAFTDKVNYFGGNLIMLKPKTNCDLDKVVSYINSEAFKHNFMFSGRFKIGHRQISNSYIPSKYL